MLKRLYNRKHKLCVILFLTLMGISLTGCTFTRKVKENNFMGNYLNTALPHDTEVDDREGYFDTK